MENVNNTSDSQFNKTNKQNVQILKDNIRIFWFYTSLVKKLHNIIIKSYKNGIRKSHLRQFYWYYSKYLALIRCFFFIEQAPIGFYCVQLQLLPSLVYKCTLCSLQRE